MLEARLMTRPFLSIPGSPKEPPGSALTRSNLSPQIHPSFNCTSCPNMTAMAPMLRNLSRSSRCHFCAMRSIWRSPLPRSSSRTRRLFASVYKTPSNPSKRNQAKCLQSKMTDWLYRCSGTALNLSCWHTTHCIRGVPQGHYNSPLYCECSD